MRALSGSFVALISVLFFSFISVLPPKASANKLRSVADIQETVGLLQTERETYPEELTFSYNIYELLTGLGAFVTRIDYNTIVDFDSIRDQALLEADGKTDRLHEIEARIIKQQVAAFLKEKGITRVFIPGNFYNLDTEPYAPTENRQLITAALAEIVHENPDIKIMGVCGGLQGIMHAMGVKIVRVHLLVGSHESAAVHAVSMPDPHGKDVVLHRLRIVPGSRLAEIVSKHVEPDENWWYSLFFPDAHGGVVSSDRENIKKLEELGYEIVGFSDDGIIEALEDKHGNILFQDHPEALAINLLKGNLFPITNEVANNRAAPKEDLRYKAAIAAISVIEDFLYRK
ncbi:gamma-glutamyl-gamma-aminobutyrate hydrolase family protein [Candidatus Anaplasma sp. TIGMIC]|uniref:gamma-glutamyl-gamma-aminobutyrate hydrolase family protein n=1 Tax=Candidatus Anaplasma sp. TIGMIC TaxID=3020713 RepID=UPI002330B6E7|nr:gamma-glutamyl-gamma-aminobutyrate hydrolase family protein [Candidatus Anaplasma sp. TIGMIC]MDB1135693.1 gamma-glutamyl-gamma-aminobutyrate hydrolase family protein [Candidatus Anaplasma sp. TIGMIC]